MVALELILPFIKGTRRRAYEEKNWLEVPRGQEQSFSIPSAGWLIRARVTLEGPGDLSGRKVRFIIDPDGWDFTPEELWEDWAATEPLPFIVRLTYYGPPDGKDKYVIDFLGPVAITLEEVEQRPSAPVTVRIRNEASGTVKFRYFYYFTEIVDPKAVVQSIRKVLLGEVP